MADDRSSRLGSREGMSLFAVSLILCALFVAGGTVFTLQLNDVRATKRRSDKAQATLQAESGGHYVLAHLDADFRSGVVDLDGDPVTVDYQAPPGYAFDGVLQLVPMVDARHYQFAVTGHSGAARTVLEVVVRAPPTLSTFAGKGLGHIELDGATAQGDLGSNGDIMLKAGASVSGDARPGTGKNVYCVSHIYYDSGTDGDDTGPCLVSGATTPVTSPLPAPHFDSLRMAEVSTANNNAALPAAAWSGAALVVAPGQPLALPPGVYYASSVRIEDDVQLSGPVDLYVSGDVYVLAGAAVNTNTANADNLRIFSGTTGQIVIDGGSEVLAHICAPSAAAAGLLGGSTLRGSLETGGSLFLDAGSRILSRTSGGATSTVLTVCSWRAY